LKKLSDLTARDIDKLLTSPLPEVREEVVRRLSEGITFIRGIKFRRDPKIL